MKYIKVAQITEIPAGSKKKISAEGKEILVTNIDGSYYAVDNTCTHMGGSLYDGKLEGQHIVCPRHGSVFDVTTGKALGGGKLLFLKVKVSDLKTYPTKVEGTDLLIGFE
jgi:3-phenylpropionate/trans-cinnamate dioxygenase ferredoxin subunit